MIRDALKKLPEILQSYELPLCIASATLSGSPKTGLLAATDRRVLFYGKDGLGRNATVDIPYDRISSVTVESKLTKNVVINAGGNNEKFHSVTNSKADQIATTIREKVSLSRSMAAAPIAPSPSNADELAKMAALHRQGILSDEEFASVKSRLLKG